MGFGGSQGIGDAFEAGMSESDEGGRLFTNFVSEHAGGSHISALGANCSSLVPKGLHEARNHGPTF
eukprot:39996-Amphidinium_carterae.1